jgi:cellulase
MGIMENENQSVNDVKFFKIHEATYDPKTLTWGSDWLIKDNNTIKATIPSDLKPGMYIVRHELISLHFSFNGNEQTKTSGAQHFPQCAKVEILGDGTTVPPGDTFPGTYKWNDQGILDNIYYGVNRYVSLNSFVHLFITFRTLLLTRLP